ncbi:MAG: hypothetical protein KDA41_03215, partial [Planctomycetales bacterium]|nr:hypothetical protein [Planctomycetales bacterium]
ADKPPSDLYLRAAVGSAIAPLDGGWYDVDGQLRVRIAGGTAVVRSSGGKQELIVHVEFQGAKAQISQEYDW